MNADLGAMRAEMAAPEARAGTIRGRLVMQEEGSISSKELEAELRA